MSSLRSIFVYGILLAFPCASFDVCPRSPIGSELQQPASISSANGLLNVTLFFSERREDVGGNSVSFYCYTSETGFQSPTLRVRPGDAVLIRLINNLTQGDLLESQAVPLSLQCGSASMQSTSVNLHFHGLPISPICTQDSVFTLVNGGESFTYEFFIPLDIESGMYAAHAHVHGMAENQVQGGASFVIIVEGIERYKPETGGLPERIIAIRDEPVPATPSQGAPAWDISVNYAPLPFPEMIPPNITMRPEATELWRVVNLASGSIFNIQLLFDGFPTTLRVVALDGVPLPVNLDLTTINLGNLARAEFLVTAPSSPNVVVTFVTLDGDTGPGGDEDPPRPLANIVLDADAQDPPIAIPPYFGFRVPIAMSQLATATPDQSFELYFSSDDTNFYITVDGKTPKPFSSFDEPALTVAADSIVRMRISNRADEVHIFHIHQVHFLPVLRNDQPVSAAESQLFDTISIPHWSGDSSDPFPSVTIMMDFAEVDIGVFMFHCHILEHEDGGMMGMIRVVDQDSFDAGHIAAEDWRAWLKGAAVGIGGCLFAGAVGVVVLRLVQRRRAQKPSPRPPPNVAKLVFMDSSKV
eukprot:c13726_g1_i1.p1 GENE.c13726_g1_i1~~c13726_g1_i1.p1  ORF type:complete len:593 (-),score=122.10 c13726_g1_i1:4-1755(-)